MPSKVPYLLIAYVVWTKDGDIRPQVTRFRHKREANEFAKGRFYEGRPAIARSDNIPLSLAKRYGIKP